MVVEDSLTVKDLLGQISRIREKATESEAVVRNITKEIQVLDLAKKNLILSMTTLKRLQMLGTSSSFSYACAHIEGAFPVSECDEPIGRPNQRAQVPRYCTVPRGKS